LELLTIKRTAAGAKAYQRDDREDRTIAYRIWRREVERSPYTSDVDQVEWVVVDGEVVPAAVLELTRIDHERIGPAYLQAILDRYNTQGQGMFARHVGRRLRCDAYIVAYKHDLTTYHLYNLSQERGWVEMSKERYTAWLQHLYKFKASQKRLRQSTARRTGASWNRSLITPSTITQRVKYLVSN
jgi:hypothetical protein